MIFKTLNSDLTIFNKELIATKDNLKSLQTENATVYNKHGAYYLQGLLVNSSPTESSFTKIKNALKAYNENLSKSTQLQNAYIQAVGKQNVSLGNYLAGLNSAKASLRGYIKSLVAAKAASIGLQAASVALNTAISMGITLALSAIISLISKCAHAQEEARQKAIELANSYKEQRDSLDSQIKKYKELKEALDNGNLSTDKTRSIKEQLLDIQKSLIESYGNEVTNIDLVNGKYKEQLGLLTELSKEKATNYVTENRDVFADAKKALEKIRTYNIGTVTSWSSYAPQTEDQQKLQNFIKEYDDQLELNTYGSSYGSALTTVMTLSIKANVESADEIMRQFAEDLEKFGKDNNIDVTKILERISGQLKKTWTDELKEYKTIYNEFMKAEIVRNDSLRPLYQQSIQAVEDYNNALSSGEGIAEAKENLDIVRQSVQCATGILEGSQEVFDEIYDRINKSAESAYYLGQAFENDESVRRYAEQLKGLTDIDLQAINFEDNVQSLGEEALGALLNILGLSKDEIQNLIDKLVELGYIQGKIQGSELNRKNIFLSITQTINQLNTRLKPAFDSLKSAYSDIFTDDGSLDRDSTDILSTCDSIKSRLDELNEMQSITIDYSSYENFVRVLRDSRSEPEDVERAFNSLAASITRAALTGTEDFETMKAVLEDLGVANNEIVAFDALASNAEMLEEALTQANVSMDDFIVNAEEGSAEATEAGLAFLEEKAGAENCARALSILAFHKQLCILQEMDTAAEVANLKSLAENAGYTGEVVRHLTELEQIYQEAAGGTIDPVVMGAKLGRAAMLQALIREAAGKINYKVDYRPMEKAAAKAGSAAGESYIDALKDRLSGLNDVISHISDTIDGQIDLFEEQKEAAVDALEAEKKAAGEALEAEKALVQEKLDARQAEIDRMKEAADARKNELDLQKALYDLERMQNQKTVLRYSEAGGMHYVTDTGEIRSARETVTEAKENIRVAGLEKDISGLDGILDELDRKIEESGRYYDSLIEETEKYWGSLIRGLEDYKSHWQELTEIEERAEMEAALISHGIAADDILNMSESAFRSFKDAYLDLLNEMYTGNDIITGMLRKTAGISADTFMPLTGTVRSAGGPDRFAVSPDSAAAGARNTGEITETSRRAAPEPYNPDLDPSGFGAVLGKWNAHLDNTRADFLRTDIMNESVRKLSSTVNQIKTNSTSIVSNRNQPIINVGGITITCPGVTTHEVMRNVKTALQNEFNGFSRLADQWART